MPFTPFHFGPGLLVKGVASNYFSWTTFVAVQMVIDCETLYHIVQRNYPLHRELHTFVGATAAGLAVAGVFLGIRRLLPSLARRAETFGGAAASEGSAVGIIAGGVIGGASHPFLDGLMHPDIRPFAPWTDANPFLGVVDLGFLHLGCFAAALIGAVLVWQRMNREGRKT